MTIKSKLLITKKDTRGLLVELIKPSDIGNKFDGQIFLTTAYPGQTKGNHYHLRKTEWYSVIKGKGRLTLIDNKTKEKKQKTMSDKRFELVEIPPDKFHFITNVGDDEMYLLVYVNEVYNPKDADTFFERP